MGFLNKECYIDSTPTQQGRQELLLRPSPQEAGYASIERIDAGIVWAISNSHFLIFVDFLSRFGDALDLQNDGRPEALARVWPIASDPEFIGNSKPGAVTFLPDMFRQDFGYFTVGARPTPRPQARHRIIEVFEQFDVPSRSIYGGLLYGSLYGSIFPLVRLKLCS